MPGLSTHVNFARLVLERTDVPFDRVHYILGCVAPDCINLSDGNAFAQSHFISSGRVPDSDIFLNKANIAIHGATTPTGAFLHGYFGHLWLDRYIHDHGHTLLSVNNPDMSETEIPAAFKNNIWRYDLGYIRDIIDVDITEFAPDVSLFPFLTGELIFIRLSETLKRVEPVGDNLPTVISEEHYINYLIEAADIFLSQASLTGRANIT